MFQLRMKFISGVPRLHFRLVHYACLRVLVCLAKKCVGEVLAVCQSSVVMSSSPSAHRSTGDFGHTSLERNTDSYIQGEKVISRLLNGHTSNQDAANLLSTYPSYILSALGWKVRSNIASEYASATIGVSETSTDVTRQSPEEWLPVLATKYSRYAHVAHLTQE